MNPYEALANAIITQATKDYRTAAPHGKAAIRRFFRSAYFTVLTSLDPEYLIARLEAEKA
ncbi:hypothetical protein HF878_07685 [Selenomonas bovis]|uniref:Uncharacterized protein n=1 Tax=Selenomonas bovis TaxID=416586 RepID=A0A848BDQ3_9FIRM|nr:hypothetical protein [Selenomonas bovis]NMD99347.1 hypothetical protein [Selenomonas bovis]